MIAGPCVIDHPLLGSVTVNPRRSSVNVVARWRDGRLHVSVPARMTRDSLMAALASMAPRIMARRPTARFSDGMVMALDGLEIHFGSQSIEPGAVMVRAALPVSRILVGSGVGWDNEVLISRAAVRVAAGVAPSLLLPRAREIARRLGLEPAGWRVSRGARTLGTCHTSGLISLSAHLVFLPLRLRDYIVCHELAHLREMNHGAGFHNLVDSYLGGREADLQRELRTFAWPVLR